MKIKGMFTSSLKKKIDLVLNASKNREEIFEELEELLILADISMELVDSILANVKKKIKLTFEKDDFYKALKDELNERFASVTQDSGGLDDGKNVILLVGINGSGKTTTAAKLAYHFSQKGKKVLLGAADTFRAAGSSQLSLWGERLGIPVIGGQKGADPGSVVFNSLTSFDARDFDLLIVDTAGRVQTKDNLMRELEKLTNIVKKFYLDQPADTLLVVDGTMGQNTLDQAKRFSEFSGITGIVLSKIDGTAKGGTVLNILDALKIPVKFAGVGEGEKDLLEFSSKEFVESLFMD